MGELLVAQVTARRSEEGLQPRETFDPGDAMIDDERSAMHS
jgi:hypothetical protein